MPNVYCCIKGCHSSTYQLKKWKLKTCPTHNVLNGIGRCVCSPPYVLFPFPQNPDQKSTWIKAVGRKDKDHQWKSWRPNKDSRICSLHFVDRYVSPENPCPSLFLGHKDEPVKKKSRRTLVRKPVIVPSNTTESEHETIEIDTPQEESPSVSCSPAASLYDHTYQFKCECSIGCACVGCKEKTDKISELTDRISLLDLQLADERQNQKKEHSLCKKLLTTNSKVSFYTGLPSLEVFNTIFEFFKPLAEKMRYWRGGKKTISTKASRRFVASPKKQGPQRKMLLQDELLLTLMRLRMDLMLEDLSDRFDVSVSTASSVFQSWISLLSKHLRKLIFFPTRDIVLANMPTAFIQKQCKARVIIDCTEVFIERPRDLRTQSLTWSDYKKNNTAKFLVGITPQGHICFLSSAWGGRTSDKDIVLNSGFLDAIDDGDEIMADRGFPIKEDLLLRRAKLTIPPSSKGQEQMSSADVSITKHVANLRIHVERAINRIKWFHILNGTVPITLMPCIDDIIVVCAALCNILPPLVK